MRGPVIVSVLIALGTTVPPSSHDQGRSATLPIVSGRAVPKYPPIAITAGIQGTVLLHVHTDGEGVESVEVAEGVQLLDAAATDVVRSWHFASTTPESFDSTVAFRLTSDEMSCRPLAPLELDMEAPSTTTIGVPANCLIEQDGGGQAWKTEPVGPTITGTVRCACDARFVIPDASVELIPEKRGSVRTLSAKTGASGTYEFRDVPDGDYGLRIRAVAFAPLQGAWIHVRHKRPAGPARDDRLEPDSLRVSGLDIPTYPRRAIASGIEGQVHIKVSSGPYPVVIDGDPILASSALANAFSWRIDGGTGSPIVTYTYSLIDDCTNPNPHVTMKLPFEVNVVGKRQARCKG